MASKRRRFSEEEKLNILQKARRMGVTTVLHEYKLSYSVFARWKKQFAGNEETAEYPSYNINAKYELNHLLLENGRLKKIIAEQALELERKEEELKKYNY